MQIKAFFPFYVAILFKEQFTEISGDFFFLLNLYSLTTSLQKQFSS